MSFLTLGDLGLSVVPCDEDDVVCKARQRAAFACFIHGRESEECTQAEEHARKAEKRVLEQPPRENGKITSPEIERLERELRRIRDTVRDRPAPEPSDDLGVATESPELEMRRKRLEEQRTKLKLKREKLRALSREPALPSLPKPPRPPTTPEPPPAPRPRPRPRPRPEPSPASAPVPNAVVWLLAGAGLALLLRSAS